MSHWGRVYVEERYKLRNAGTTVVPPFSRWNLTAEAMRGGYAASPHLRVLPFSLPRAAQYIYAKDDLGAMQARPTVLQRSFLLSMLLCHTAASLPVVGTVILSALPWWELRVPLGVRGFRRVRRTTVRRVSLPTRAPAQIVQPPASEGRAAGVSLVPRYPILGGWTSEMVLGYSLPLAATAQRNGRRHAVLFMVPPLIDFVRPLSPRSVQAVVRSEAAGRNRAACAYRSSSPTL